MNVQLSESTNLSLAVICCLSFHSTETMACRVREQKQKLLLDTEQFPTREGCAWGPDANEPRLKLSNGEHLIGVCPENPRAWSRTGAWQCSWVAGMVRGVGNGCPGA